MARETNAAITFEDAKDMVSLEGYVAKSFFTENTEVMTKAEIEANLHVDNTDFVAYESNRIVPYHLIKPRVTAWREIDPYCVQDANWTLILKTNSSRPNWCLNRFRLFFADNNTKVQARRPDGSVISEQLFHDPNYTSWDFNGSAPSYDHTFMFDLSFNTTNQDIEIYIQGVPANTQFQQIYAVDAHAGTAVRYREDPLAWGYSSTSGADLTYINMGFLKFDRDAQSSIVYLEHQNLHTISKPYEFHGRIIDVSYNNLSSLAIDQLITGIDDKGVAPANIGGQQCRLTIDAGLRTSASAASWGNLLAKGWILTEI